VKGGMANQAIQSGKKRRTAVDAKVALESRRKIHPESFEELNKTGEIVASERNLAYGQGAVSHLPQELCAMLLALFHSCSTGCDRFFFISRHTHL